MDVTGPGFESTHPMATEDQGVGPELVMTTVYPQSVAGRVVPLQHGIVVGRAPGAGSGQIAHATISRHHASVRLGLGGVPCLEDAGSRNGAWVDGVRLVGGPRLLSVGTVVRLGDVLAIVHEASDDAFGVDPALPGSSVSVVRARQQLGRAASESASVLVVGETGTGKERLAAEVHRRSGRPGPYVALNCAELSSQLIESQLFGHERGAFTGAHAAKRGLFAAANGGTLFLDEIGELPLELQPKLLRVLQEGEIRPVGSLRAERVDVRVVAATNRDLPAMIDAGAFRRDLHARLSAWQIDLPSIRSSRQDIFPWLERLAQIRGMPGEFAARFTPDAAARVLEAPWLDNLRGLDRLVQRLAAHPSGRLGLQTLLDAMPDLVEPSSSDVPTSATPASPSASTGRQKPRQRPSREELLEAYESSGFSVRATSRHFDRDRRQIYRWLEYYDIPRHPEPAEPT